MQSKATEVLQALRTGTNMQWQQSIDQLVQHLTAQLWSDATDTEIATMSEALAQALQFEAKLRS